MPPHPLQSSQVFRGVENMDGGFEFLLVPGFTREPGPQRGIVIGAEPPDDIERSRGLLLHHYSI